MMNMLRKRHHLNVGVKERGFVSTKCIMCESLKDLISKLGKIIMTRENMNWSWENIFCIKSCAKPCTILGGLSLCVPKMNSYMPYKWQNGSCENYTPKVASGKWNDLWAWTIAHYLDGYDNSCSHGDERYTQYSNELWLDDRNFTIGSLLWFFELWKKLKLMSPRSCLSTLPKVHSLHIFCKENLAIQLN